MSRANQNLPPSSPEPLLQRIHAARDLLWKVEELGAPIGVVDALCAWIGGLEDVARKRGIDPYDEG